MKFLVISDAPTLKKNHFYYAYAPYVNEMNIWMKYCNTTIVSPTYYKKPLLTSSFFKKPKVKSIPFLVFTNFSKSFGSFLSMPYIFFIILKEMLRTDHIHLRCPGNISLLATIAQIFFPSKKKTVKYAGNWDPKSKQPLSYRIQKWIVSNTFLTKNCKVLVYGEWGNQSKNVIPFFTASYSKNEIIEIPKKDLSQLIKFIFVGAFSGGKQPLLSVKTIQNLLVKGYNVQLDMYGNGDRFNDIKDYIEENNLNNNIILHGNKAKDVVKKAYQNSHFLIFISKSEGWPKVVAEAMFWGCLPISSKVSCVPYMLGYGKRGTMVDSKIKEKELEKVIIDYLNDEQKYQKQILKAKNWSQKYTLNKFETEIKKILIGE
jgi:glycosyltransferase involved in cell wall biosynthesis